jgi:hypothetical protein
MKITNKTIKEQALWITCCVILSLMITVLLYIPPLTATSYAQVRAHQIGNYGGIAYLAEREIRENEAKELVSNNEKDITANFIIIDGEKRFSFDDVKGYATDNEEPAEGEGK